MIPPLHLPVLLSFLPNPTQTHHHRNPTQPNQTHSSSSSSSTTTTTTKMSSTPSTPPTTQPTKPTFTEKELRVLQHAWSCLKSPPEIDLEKLRVAAGFNTPKTASNTWGVIKKKLAAMSAGEGGGEGGEFDLFVGSLFLCRRGMGGLTVVAWDRFVAADDGWCWCWCCGEEGDVGEA